MAELAQPFESLAARLQRRKLFQWSAAYLAAAWMVYQVAGLVGQTFEWPSVVMRVLTIVLGVGFLAAIVVAWFHGEHGYQRVTGLELAIFAGLALLAGAGVTLIGRGPAPASAEPSNGLALVGPSVGVLPFTSLSADPDNAFFAGGIQDEIITQLSQLPNLQVISRTTMVRYENTTKTGREIAAELGVRAVLEGSVQRLGDRVRINAQLIDGRTDAHLWAESFDRGIDDLFAVQTEVARGVVGALSASLTQEQAAELSRRPTANADAYQFYLRGIDYAARPRLEENIRNAVRTLEQSVSLDPGFAEAWAALSSAHVSLYWYGYEPSKARLEQGRSAAERAVRLAPNLPAARMAMANAHYRAREYDQALEVSRSVLAQYPAFADAPWITALVLRRQGRWTESAPLVERAVALDPGSNVKRFILAHDYMVLRRFADAEATLERAIVLAPDESPDAYGRLYELYLSWQGDLEAARAAANRIPDRFAASRTELLACLDASEGHYTEGLSKLASLSSEERIGCRELAGPKSLLVAVLLEQSGDSVRAAAAYRDAAAQLEKTVQDKDFDPSAPTPVRASLGFAYAGLGRTALAREMAEQAMRELPMSVDALDGLGRMVGAAYVYVRLREYERATALIEKVLATPSLATPTGLRLDPFLGPLRGQPRFEQVLQRAESRTGPP